MAQEALFIVHALTQEILLAEQWLVVSCTSLIRVLEVLICEQLTASRDNRSTWNYSWSRGAVMQAVLLLSVILLVGGGSSDAVGDCSNEIRLAMVSELECLSMQFSIRSYVGVIGSAHVMSWNHARFSVEAMHICWPKKLTKLFVFSICTWDLLPYL